MCHECRQMPRFRSYASQTRHEVHALTAAEARRAIRVRAAREAFRQRREVMRLRRGGCDAKKCPAVVGPSPDPLLAVLAESLILRGDPP